MNEARHFIENDNFDFSYKWKVIVLFYLSSEFLSTTELCITFYNNESLMTMQ